MSSEDKRNVLSYVSRYVVPFYFDYENNGYKKLNDYFTPVEDNENKGGLPDDVVKEYRMSSKVAWKNEGFCEGNAEMEIYSYLPKVFLEKDNNYSNLGNSFVLDSNGKLLKLEYKCNGKSINFDLTKLGIFLYRNGVGFIWYETRLCPKEISTEEYIGFQSAFKELARTEYTGFSQILGKEEYVPFCMGKWLSRLICAKECGISFWAEIEKDNKTLKIPDKALLFQYVFVDHLSDQERNDLAFHLANGYDRKYNTPEDISACMCKPFKNVSFYLTNAGMVSVAEKIDTNEDFFKNQFPGKIKSDYFFIFLLLFYQSYSCAHYARLLTMLPAEEKKFTIETQHIDRLEALTGQVNLFLVKSVFESVSNMHHQNEIYRYGKARLHISEDIQSLSTGLNSLKDIEKEKQREDENFQKEKQREEIESRDRKINYAVVVFGIMLIVSAAIDGLNLVDYWGDRGAIYSLRYIVIFILLLIPTIYLLYTLLHKNKKGNNMSA